MVCLLPKHTKGVKKKNKYIFLRKILKGNLFTNDNVN